MTARIKLYRAVLKESDPQKRLAQLEETERVMKQALRRAVEEGDSDQRRSISDALHHLEIIRRGDWVETVETGETVDSREVQ